MLEGSISNEAFYLLEEVPYNLWVRTQTITAHHASFLASSRLCGRTFARTITGLHSLFLFTLFNVDALGNAVIEFQAFCHRCWEQCRAYASLGRLGIHRVHHNTRKKPPSFSHGSQLLHACALAFTTSTRCSFSGTVK